MENFEMKKNKIKQIIKNFKALEKKDQIVFFLLCSTINNFVVGIVKLFYGDSVRVVGVYKTADAVVDSLESFLKRIIGGSKNGAVFARSVAGRAIIDKAESDRCITGVNT